MFIFVSSTYGIYTIFYFPPPTSTFPKKELFLDKNLLLKPGYLRMIFKELQRRQEEVRVSRWEIWAFYVVYILGLLACHLLDNILTSYWHSLDIILTSSGCPPYIILTLTWHLTDITLTSSPHRYDIILASSWHHSDISLALPWQHPDIILLSSWHHSDISMTS